MKDDAGLDSLAVSPIRGHQRDGGDDFAPAAALERTLSFDLSDPEIRQRAARLRRRGLDDDGVRFCLAMLRLDAIIENNRRRKKHIFIAAFPKSASTYLEKVLLAATGFESRRLEALGGDNEQNIDFKWLPAFLARDTVTCQHARATQPNIDMLNRLGVRPVVCVRDIFDTLVSVRDHLVNESLIGPAAHVPRQFGRWGLDRQMWYVVRSFTPWYLSFLTSWLEAQSSVDALRVTYDEVTRDTANTVRRILAHSGVAVRRRAVEDAVESTGLGDVRFNKGVPGRGRSILTDAQRNAVIDIADTYNGMYDLRGIGLHGGPGPGER